MRARLCQVLATVGPSVVPALLPRLTESRWYVVRNVVSILGKIGDESTFLSVVNVLDHPHPRVRLEAVRALGVIGGRMAVTPLIRCLDDPDPTVRGAAVRALGALQDEEAVAALHGLVTRPGLGAPDDLAIRHEAINALAAIGTPEARRALSELASRRVWFWNRVEKRIRDMAAEALRASRHAMAGAMRDGDDG
ncbi:MAG: HEAT repeat domain-containing protein [Candidatus Rokubacteria bacterium]|nr:HEAT repeat domain-containing protein [Candidatus Rokubacteria bacterium]